MLESMLTPGLAKQPSPYNLFLEASKNFKTIGFGQAPGRQEGWFQTYIGQETGTMIGTTWGGYVVHDTSAIARMLQHAFPSYAVFLNQRTKSLRCAFKTVWSMKGASKYVATNRNNYQSQGLSWANESSSITYLVYYDDVAEKMMVVEPYYRSGPKEWDGIFH